MDFQSRASLEILDDNLHLIGTVAGDPGRLAGADKQGNLYFTRISKATGMKAAKAHLVPTP
jgi:hypothetical protein